MHDDQWGTISAHSFLSSTRLRTRGAFDGLEGSPEVGLLRWVLHSGSTRPCHHVRDHVMHSPGPLRERLLRYYAETADQVQRLLRVTANGAQLLPCGRDPAPLAVLLAHACKVHTELTGMHAQGSFLRHTLDQSCL